MTTKKRIPAKRPTKNSPAKRPPAGAQTGAGGSTAKPSAAAAPKPSTDKSSGGRAVCTSVGAPRTEDTAEKTATSEAATSPVTTASGASPSQSTDTNDHVDGTTPHAVVRTVLAGLDNVMRLAVISALLAWCHSLAAVADAVKRGTGPAAARRMVDGATEALTESGLPHAVVCSVVGAWFGHGPYDVAQHIAAGACSATEVLDLAQYLDALPAAEPHERRSVRKVTAVGDLPEGCCAVLLDGEMFVRANRAPRLVRLPLDATAKPRALAAVMRDVARALSTDEGVTEHGAHADATVRRWCAGRATWECVVDLAANLSALARLNIDLSEQYGKGDGRALWTLATAAAYARLAGELLGAVGERFDLPDGLESPAVDVDACELIPGGDLANDILAETATAQPEAIAT